MARGVEHHGMSVVAAINLNLFDTTLRLGLYSHCPTQSQRSQSSSVNRHVVGQIGNLPYTFMQENHASGIYI